MYPVGSFVRLSNGDYGVVAFNNSKNSSRPLVKVVFDAKLQSKGPKLVDLSLVDGNGSYVEIQECLNPVQYRIDVTKLLAA